MGAGRSARCSVAETTSGCCVHLGMSVFTFTTTTCNYLSVQHCLSAHCTPSDCAGTPRYLHNYCQCLNSDKIKTPCGCSPLPDEAVSSGSSGRAAARRWVLQDRARPGPWSRPAVGDPAWLYNGSRSYRGSAVSKLLLCSRCWIPKDVRLTTV